MKTDKKMEELKKEFEDTFGGGYSVHPDGNHLVFENTLIALDRLWVWITSNFTPNTEVQKAREDGVRGLVDRIADDFIIEPVIEGTDFPEGMEYTPSIADDLVVKQIEEIAETYLQSLKDKDE